MFHLTLDQAYRWFDHYNQTLFAQRLPKTKIELSQSMTSTAGKVLGQLQPVIRLSVPILTQEQAFHETLVHEMIHVCQRHVAQETERPHGPYFSAWMYSINQAYEYSSGYVRSPFGKIQCLGKAKLRLKITVTHHYIQDQGAERQSLVGKIKKLLALSESPYEHEAQSALLKAQQLMQSHAVSDEEIDRSEEGSELDMPIVRELLVKGKRVPVYWKRSLLMVIAKYYKCQYIEASGQGIGVYGHRTYVEIVRHLFHYYEEVIEQMARQHQGQGAVFLNNFRSGMVERLTEKLAQRQTEPCLTDLAQGEEDLPMNQTETGLVQLRQEAMELRDYIGLINPGFYTRRGNVSYVRLNPKARKKGYETGKHLSVNDQITPRQKKLKASKNKGFG
ncbi:SprT-like domain-containing protein [Lyngbya confervoides]|uniref:SprT-like domain-containing protein n=1 Tax=Lyngbya confervoides BDU141951 TaxID=1574623 RepID=A0ABD4T317_9CYAN|nr:SprT-like domain-containing protein [Lyngbya confervoides]MCM1982830.1 SprT-like domain-containing protein [Lyngbya confervoides BDU141951]